MDPETALEELIAQGGSCSWEFLAREFGKDKADEPFSHYGEKLREK